MTVTDVVRDQGHVGGSILAELRAMAALSDFGVGEDVTPYRIAVTPHRFNELVAEHRELLASLTERTDVAVEITRMREVLALFTEPAGGAFWTFGRALAGSSARSHSRWGAAVAQRNVIARAARIADVRLAGLADLIG